MCLNQEGALPHNLGMRNGDMLDLFRYVGELYLYNLFPLPLDKVPEA